MNHGLIFIVLLASSWLMQPQTAFQPSAIEGQPTTLTPERVCGGSASYDQLTADERQPPPPQIISFGLCWFGLPLLVSLGVGLFAHS